MTDYFELLLLLPVVVMPFLFVLKLAPKKMFICIVVSFFAANIVDIALENTFISSTTLVLLFLITHCLLNLKIKHKRHEYAIVLTNDNDFLTYYNGQEIVEIPYFSNGQTLFSRILRITKTD